MSHSDEQQGGTADLPPALPVHLSALVDYQRGAVVSRTLKKGQAGTFTVFAFDEGESLSEHTAPFDAFVLVLDGKVELTIGGRPVIAQAGETVLMPANVPHALRAPERFKMALLMIRG
jgi:quercetin dioxygenase-like cupin family protein